MFLQTTIINHLNQNKMKSLQTYKSIMVILACVFIIMHTAVLLGVKGNYDYLYAFLGSTFAPATTIYWYRRHQIVRSAKLLLALTFNDDIFDYNCQGFCAVIDRKFSNGVYYLTENERKKLHTAQFIIQNEYYFSGYWFKAGDWIARRNFLCKIIDGKY